MSDVIRSNMSENQADFCRRHGIVVGTRLAGDEGYGETIIEIDYVGRTKLLASTVSHAGKPPMSYTAERSWNLGCRDWRIVE